MIRHPEHRGRFAAIHARLQEPFAAVADELGEDLPVDPLRFAIAINSMHVGLALERLTQPEVIGPDVGPRMLEFVFDALSGTGDEER